MRTIHFEIVNIEAIDSYLYAGNLYVIFADGHIGYISFDRIIHMLRDRYNQYDNIIQLAFLHNDYLQTPSGLLIMGIPGVRTAVEKEWDKAQKEIVMKIDYNEIRPYFYNFGDYPSMPLDLRLYAMRMYVACKDGLYESRLHQDEKSSYVEHTDLERVFDSKVVAVNAKYGAIAISADKEGLFSSELREEEGRINVSNKPILNSRSLRTDWKDIDLLNYDSASEFNYLHNKSERTKKDQPFFYELRKGNEHKHITEIGTEVEDMMPLLDNIQVKKEDVEYCFSSNSTIFIRMKNGDFFSTNFQSLFDGPYMCPIKELGKKKKILSSVVIPNGCVLNYFDQTVMYRGGKSTVLSDQPAYGVRSYMNAKRYRSLLTINTEDSLCVYSAETFSPFATAAERNGSLGRVRLNNVFRGKSQIELDFVNIDELTY